LVDVVWARLLNLPLVGHRAAGAERDQAALGRWAHVRAQMADQLGAQEVNLRSLVRALAQSRVFGLGPGVASDDDQPWFGSVPTFARFYSLHPAVRMPQDCLAIVDRSYRDRQGDLVAMRAVLAQRQPIGVTPVEPAREPIVVQQALPKNMSLWGVDDSSAAALEKIVTSNMSHRQKTEHLFLASLRRLPNEAELKLAETIVQSAAGDANRTLQAYQDIWWALLNSYEYRGPVEVR
jgi:hypothetical protein